VQSALELLLEAGQVPNVDSVKRLIGGDDVGVPDMAPLEADLGIYDVLLTTGGLS
jgi:hypothetical protein